MTLPKEIEITICSLSEQKVTVQIKGRLTLADTHLLYEMEFYADETDDDTALLVKDVYNNGKEMYLRKAATGVDYTTLSTEKIRLEIVFTNGITKIYFDTQSEATAVFETVKEWILSYQ